MSNFERTAYYIGFCNNLIRRVIEHKYGLGSKFTAEYKLTDLLYYESYKYVDDAIRREKELKKWRREKKINLIKSINPKFSNLSVQLFKDCDITEDDEKDIIKELREKYRK